jgi:hypothetical protein
MTLALMIAHGVNSARIMEILAVEPKKTGAAAGQSLYLGCACRHPGDREKRAPGSCQGSSNIYPFGSSKNYPLAHV